MLIDDGSLRREDDRWVASLEPAEATTPRTVQALIAARLDRLGEDERAILQRGSVVGKVFYWGAVAETSQCASARRPAAASRSAAASATARASSSTGPSSAS